MDRLRASLQLGKNLAQLRASCPYFLRYLLDMYTQGPMLCVMVVGAKLMKHITPTLNLVQSSYMLTVVRPDIISFFTIALSLADVIGIGRSYGWARLSKPLHRECWTGRSCCSASPSGCYAAHSSGVLRRSSTSKHSDISFNRSITVRVLQLDAPPCPPDPGEAPFEQRLLRGALNLIRTLICHAVFKQSVAIVG